MTRFIASLRTPGTLYYRLYYRTTTTTRQPKAKPPSPRQAAMLLARRPEKLKPDEHRLLDKLNECCPEIPILYGLTQGFAAVFREEKSDGLQNWIREANQTGLPEINRFCDGLRRDEKSVTAARRPAVEQRPSGRPDTSAKTREAADVWPRKIQPFAHPRPAVCPSCGQSLTLLCTESAGEPNSE